MFRVYLQNDIDYRQCKVHSFNWVIMGSAARYKTTRLEMVLVDGVLGRPRFMCIFNNVCIIALLLLWTGLIKRITSFMESLFKSDMATQGMEDYSGSNRKMWWERLSGEKQESNRKRIQRRWKDYHLQRNNETPHFSNAETILWRGNTCPIHPSDRLGYTTVRLTGSPIARDLEKYNEVFIEGVKFWRIDSVGHGRPRSVSLCVGSTERKSDRERLRKIHWGAYRGCRMLADRLHRIRTDMHDPSLFLSVRLSKVRSRET